MKKLILAVVSAITMGFVAHATDWFNGGIATGWPTAATCVGGGWTNCDDSSFEDNVLVIDADIDSPLTFTADNYMTYGTNIGQTTSIQVSASVDMTPYKAGVFPEVPDDAKAGVIAMRNADDETKIDYYYLAKDASTGDENATNVWTLVDEGPFDIPTQPIDVKITRGDFSSEGEGANVRYDIGGNTIYAVVNIPSQYEAEFKEIRFTGSASLSAFNGTIDPLMKAITIADVALATKAVEGAELVSGTTYKALDGQAVKVTYTADTGYFFADGAQTLVVNGKAGTDETLTADSGVLGIAAIGETQYVTLEGAYESAKDGDTVTLNFDQEFATGLKFASGKNITFDLNGKTLAYTDTATGNYLLTVGTNDTLIITNGTLTSTVRGINVAGNLTLASGTTLDTARRSLNVVGVDNNWDVATGTGSPAVVTIAAGATVKHGSDDGISIFVRGSSGDRTVYQAKAILNVYGTVIDAGEGELDENGTVYYGLTSNGGNATLAEINFYDGSSYTCKCATVPMMMWLPQVDLNLYGGTITSAGGGIYFRCGKFNVPSNSTVKVTANGENANALVFDRSTATYPRFQYSELPVYEAKEINATIAGGEFISTGVAISSEARDDLNNDKTVKTKNTKTPLAEFVSGGYFSNAIATDVVVDGYKAVASATKEGYYEIGADAIAGTGTEEDPWIIDSRRHLKAFRNGVNNGTYATTGAFIKQTADIDLRGETWTDIGTGLDTIPFNGNYDGQDHVVSNFVLSGVNYCGFFNAIQDNATIKNLKLLDVQSPTGCSAVSILVGDVEPPTGTKVVVENVTVSGNIDGIHNVGGFSAWLQGTVEFYNCTNLANCTTHRAKVGGFSPYYAGDDKTDSILFSNCCNKGTITLAKNIAKDSLFAVGGILAYAQSTAPVKFVDCVNEGAIVGTMAAMDQATKSYFGTSQLGGIMGVVGGSIASATFDRCVNSATISATVADAASSTSGVIATNQNATVGGIVGAVTSGSAKAVLTDCLVTTDTVLEATVAEGWKSYSGAFVGSANKDYNQSAGVGVSLTGKAPTVLAAVGNGKTAGGYVSTNVEGDYTVYAPPAGFMMLIVENAKAQYRLSEEADWIDYTNEVQLAAGSTVYWQYVADAGYKFIGDCVGSTTLGKAGSSTSAELAATLKHVGQGTVADPYLVYDAADLKAYSDAMNEGIGLTASYMLVTNIDYNGETLCVTNKGFAGTIDGANNKIANFKAGYVWAEDGRDYSAVFPYLAAGVTFKNITFEGEASAGEQDQTCAAMIACETAGDAAFENVVVKGKVQGNYNVAGFVLKIKAGSTVTFTNCVNEALIRNTAANKAAGFVSYASDAATATTVNFVNCANRGTVSVDYTSGGNAIMAGGFLSYFGCAQALTFENCANTGLICGTNNCTGSKKCSSVRISGFIAHMQPAGSGGVVTLKDCQSIGTLIGVDNVGDVTVDRMSFIGTWDSSGASVVASGTIKAVADVKPIPSGTCDALSFATVDDGIATFVDSCAVVAGSEYKVMCSDASAVELAKIGDAITLNTTLATVNVTTADAYGKVVKDGNVYTVVRNKQDLTLPEVANATADVYIGDEKQTAPYVFVIGTNVTVKWTAASHYYITAGEEQAITIAEENTVNAPTVVAMLKYYAQVYVGSESLGWGASIGQEYGYYAKGVEIDLVNEAGVRTGINPSDTSKTYYVSKLVLKGDTDTEWTFSYNGTALTKETGNDEVAVSDNTKLSYTFTTGDRDCFAAVYFTEYVAPAGPSIPEEQGSVVSVEGHEDQVEIKPAEGKTEIDVTDASVGDKDIVIPSTVNKITGVSADKLVLKTSDGAHTYKGILKLDSDGTVSLDGTKSVTIGEETISVTPTIMETSADTPITTGKLETKAIPGVRYTLKCFTSLGALSDPNATPNNSVSATATATTIELNAPVKSEGGKAPTQAFWVIEASK